MLTLFLFFFLFIFWHLTGRMSTLHSSISVLKKAVSFVFCPHFLNVSQYFIQKLPCPSNCQSVGVNVFLLKRDKYYCWLNQSNASTCTQSDAGLCAWPFFSKLRADVLKRGRVEVSGRRQWPEAELWTRSPSLSHDELQCLFIGHNSYNGGPWSWFIILCK